MKKVIYLIAVFLCFITYSCGQTQGSQTRNIETKHENLSDFHTISVQQGIIVKITPSNHNEAEISSNYLDKLQLVVKNGKLSVRYKKNISGIFNNPKTIIELQAKQIDKFIASSAGDISVNGMFSTPTATINVSSSGSIKYNYKGNQLNINASSSGDYEGKVKVKSLTVTASSSADIELEGYANQCNLEASSGADIELKKLICNNARATTSSGSDIELIVNHSLNAKASSGATIEYVAKENANDINVSSSSGSEVTAVSHF